MTEGDGHVLDPAGDARRVLQAVVAEHGPQALSDAVIMDGVCQARLSNLPGEAILIVSATRSDVPALLGDLIPRLGNHGAIQSVAASLADAHGLDIAACVWVVREFARALGLIASDGATAGAGGAGVPGGAGMAGGAGGVPPRRASSRGRVLSRNTAGIAAAIAVVAGYLGVAAVAHLSPFPARMAAATSPAPASTGGTSPSSAGSPDPAPDPTPTSDYQILLTKVPSAVQAAGSCANDGTQVGAIAVSECSNLRGLAAGTIFYYLFSDPAALATGFTAFLGNVKFSRQSECTTGNKFVSFIAECESAFTSTSPTMTGSIAEYANTDNQPIIVTTDRQQLVMAVMVGTNDGDLLAYWKQLQWAVP